MIPQELTARPHWVSAGDDKVPIDPKTGHAASPIRPSTWASHEIARAHDLPHVGYVLSRQDPYTIIDLDEPHDKEQEERHKRIVAAFDTYVETSQSGKGVHIILRGAMSRERGLRAHRVEVYDDKRYMICTGWKLPHKPDEIRDCQSALDALLSELSPDDERGTGGHRHSDSNVLEMASKAANGDKFDRLCNGHWEGEYPSQSEADMALLSILAWWSRDDEQVKRLFLASALGRRDKAHRDDYVPYTIKRTRRDQHDRPDINFDALIKKARQQHPQTKTEWPPGLLGKVAKYIHDTAIRPVPEFALGAAIAFLAGICGRQYNVNGTGLNQYVVILGKTGVGKEGATSGINRLFAALRPSCPPSAEFMGPETIASGPALRKLFTDQPSFVALWPEFGHRLRALTNPRASFADTTLKSELLKLYTRSGASDVLGKSVYSDSEKNMDAVMAPALTILAESNPQSFLSALSDEQISDGFLPRFLVLEYTGKRDYRNTNANSPPDADLVDDIGRLCSTVASMKTANVSPREVEFDAEARILEDAFDRSTTDDMNASADEVNKELWNRAHLKALRLSALIAVGQDPDTHTVSREAWEYAERLVRRDIESLLAHVDVGAIGQGDDVLWKALRGIIFKYVTRDSTPRGYGVGNELFQARGAGYVPYGYLSQRACSLVAFKRDRRGALRAFNDTLRHMADSGAVLKVPPSDAEAPPYKGALYRIVDESFLN